MKDHEANFLNNPKSRQINTKKSETGKSFKQLLEVINSEVQSKAALNQRQNILTLISCFNIIEDKNKHKFKEHDLIDF